MLMYPTFNPIALELGPVKIYWYGLMYLCAFLFFLYGAKWRIKKFGHPILTSQMIDDFLFYAALGVIIGGRLGYCFLYQPMHYLSNPLSILKTWEGGMSFHGGMAGVLLAVYYFTRKIKTSFFVLSDFIAPFIPFCLMFGRIGNFINGELWGRFSNPNLPWGMIFPQSGSMLPRHPSQLYAALFEGLILFLIIIWFSRKPRKLGQISAVFMMGYGAIRFILEYFRQPDVFATDVVVNTGLTLGQIYSIPMFVIGVAIYIWSLKQNGTLSTTTATTTSSRTKSKTKSK